MSRVLVTGGAGTIGGVRATNPYSSLKRQSRRNLVIGEDTFTAGPIAPKYFVRRMRRRTVGHPEWTSLVITPSRRVTGPAVLDTLARWIDRNLGRPRGRPIRLYLWSSRLRQITLPRFQLLGHSGGAGALAGGGNADHPPLGRIYALGWFTLHDEPSDGPNGTPGNESNRGLRVGWRPEAVVLCVQTGLTPGRPKARHVEVTT